jgi:hypothetical protein
MIIHWRFGPESRRLRNKLVQRAEPEQEVVLAEAAAPVEHRERVKPERPERAECMLERAVHMSGEVANTPEQVEHTR